MTLQDDRLYVTWVLSGADGQDHAVTDEEATRANHEGTGRAEAVCGHPVLTVSLTNPPGRKCSRCLAYLLARATLSDLDLRMKPYHRRHRCTGLLRQLLRLPARPRYQTPDRAGRVDS
ncbi:hypothetical protein ACWDKQ_18750 [Saccharopolyspora sp. NPDC000995]